LLLFAGVLGLSVYHGVEPELAVLRALGALLVLTVCGWVAEQVVASARRPPEPESEDEPEPEHEIADPGSLSSDDAS
jgi:hypothetical protein